MNLKAFDHKISKMTSQAEEKGDKYYVGMIKLLKAGYDQDVRNLSSQNTQLQAENDKLKELLKISELSKPTQKGKSDLNSRNQ